MDEEKQIQPEAEGASEDTTQHIVVPEKVAETPRRHTRGRDEPEFDQIMTDLETIYKAEHERVRQWLEENEIL